MIERFAARLRRRDEDAQILARGLLPDKLVEALRAQGRVDILGLSRGRDEAVAVGHLAAIARTCWRGQGARFMGG